MSETIERLAKAFRALTDDELRNLAWHVERGTPILCGDMANWYADGRGGG